MNLGTFASRVADFGAASVRQAVAGRMAEGAAELYRHGFERKTDPYGTRWAPRKKRERWPLMNKTGYLKASGEVTHVGPDGFRFRVYAPYAVFHEYGTRYMPAREIVPKANYGLGKWGPALKLWALNAMRQVFG